MRSCDKCESFKTISNSSAIDGQTGRLRMFKVGMCEEKRSPYFGQLIGGDNLCRELQEKSKDNNPFRAATIGR